jgi:lipoprotein signal peptidase
MQEKNTKMVITLVATCILVSNLLASKSLYSFAMCSLSPFPLMAITTILSFVLNIGGAIGVIKSKKWGFISIYFAFPLGAFAGMICYIPFTGGIIPSHLSGYSILLINLLITALLIFLQIQSKKQNNNCPTNRSSCQAICESLG